MKRILSCVIGMAFACATDLALAAAGEVQTGSAQAQLRDWTPEVSVRVRYFVPDQGSDDWLLQEGVNDAVVPSPKGNYFFFVSLYGDLDCDCSVYTLSVYAARDVARALGDANPRAPAPFRTLTMRNKIQAIESAAWVDGEETIEFRGRKEPDSPMQVYRFNVTTGQLKAMTDVPAAAELLDYRRQGENVIYTTSVSQDVPSDYPMFALTTEKIVNLVLLSKENRPRASYETVVSSGSRPAWRLKSGYFGIGDGLWFSPDGRRVLMVRRPVAVPSAWDRYDGMVKKEGFGTSSTPETERFSQYVWVDLEHEREEPVFDAPTGLATRAGGNSVPQALWSEDGSHVVFTNTALPLSQEGSGEENSRMAYVVNYDVKRQKWEVLEKYRQPSGVIVADVNWTKPGKEFLVRHSQNGKFVAGTLYSYRNGHWVAKAADALMEAPALWNIRAQRAVLAQGLSVNLRQSANDPPKVVASRKGRELVLTAPDPALDGVWIARTEALKWRDGGGVSRTSGLLLPRKMPSGGKKIPLVIQATSYLPNEFRPDGAARTAYAAQALVARGMAVLNLDPPTLIPGVGGTAQEMSMFIDWMESAAEAAAQAHPIDLDRVGLVGFSRAGYRARYTITNPRRLRPAAAVIADSYTGSYALTLIGNAMGNSVLSSGYDAFYGGPFYKSKAAWLEREVSFNVDRVQTPVLFVDNGENPVMVLDTIGAFTANRKPFEYLLLPHGIHQLRAPRQRQVSLDATTDWMAFWLLNDEDARPEKAERYERWRAQRELQKQPGNVTAPASISQR